MTADPAEASPWMPQWTFGDRLRKIRRATGRSQGEFAVLLGQNPKSYASWESDQAKPRELVAVALRIEEVTGVPAVWVLGIGAVDLPPDVPFRPIAPQTTPGPDDAARTGFNGRYRPGESATVISLHQAGRRSRMIARTGVPSQEADNRRSDTKHVIPHAS